ncbi:MAG: T9SS type A sorting domain-containing protein [Bacteroidetes bacterium]|nr:MAG: T9SS type A sorting domain-containing protein [Bacteroidota bacterium]
MKNKITVIIVSFISISCFSQSITPAVLNVAGGSSQKGYYQFEWSVGEMSLINQMESRPNLFVLTNGFLQPYILNPGVNNSNNQFGADEIKVFPTPASSYIEIDLFTRQQGRLKITLYDAIGQRMYSTELQSFGVDLIQKIPVNGFNTGTYLLHLELEADPNFISKKGIYKIIKL